MSISPTRAPLQSFAALAGSPDRAAVVRHAISLSSEPQQTLDQKAKSVLLVTEDPAVSAIVSQISTTRLFSVATASDPTKALQSSLGQQFDLLLLDTSISRIDGLVILLEIRSRNGVPTVVLASSEQDCLKAIEAGADDFVLKPFDTGEVLIRIQGVLLRRDLLRNASHHSLRCADLCLNTRTHQVWAGERPVELTSSEFTILKCLLRTPARIVSRDELALVLYHREATPFERSIDVHVSHLRKKVEQGGGVAIRTVRGVGYLIVPKTDTGQEAEKESSL